MTQPQESETQGTQSQESQTHTPVSQTLDIHPQKAQEAQPQGSQGLSEALFTQLGEEYVQEGSLSNASYETLASQGIPRNVVDIVF